MSAVGELLARPLSGERARRQAFALAAGAVLTAICVLAVQAALGERTARAPAHGAAARATATVPQTETALAAKGPTPVAPAPRRAARPSPNRGGTPPNLLAPIAAVRRFADAYMLYQIARVTPQVRLTLEQTTTPAVAHFLLAHPAQLPPTLAAHPSHVEVFRVTNVEPAAPGRFSVSYVSEQVPSDTGAFLVKLVRRAGRWLVSGMEP